MRSLILIPALLLSACVSPVHLYQQNWAKKKLTGGPCMQEMRSVLDRRGIPDEDSSVYSERERIVEWHYEWEDVTYKFSWPREDNAKCELSYAEHERRLF